MNNTDAKKIQYFVALCDDLITCKFLVAESKIQKLLVALAETQPIYELVSDCMEMFNRDREMNKAFVTDGKGRFYCVLPSEEYKLIALVFCTLADIDQKKIDFTDFIKRFFDDEEGVNCYTSFARRMIVPFRELIAEAFGIAKRYTTQEESQEENDEKEVLNDSDNLLVEPSKLYEDCKNIVNDMLIELEENERHYDRHISDLKSILQQLAIACDNQDYNLIYALSIGAKFASKGVKSVKFLMREFEAIVNALSLEESE